MAFLKESVIMDNLGLLVIVIGVIALLNIAFNGEGWITNRLPYVDNFVLDWFEKRNLASNYQTWGHCGLCGRPLEGVFPKDWAWGVCDNCSRSR